MQLPHSGSIPALTCKSDARYCYFAYIPAQKISHTLVVLHGTDRRAETMRDALIPWASRQGVAVLSPLFPAGVAHENDVDDYKYLRTDYADYGRAITTVVRDAADRFVLPTTFAIVGFSGGAQLANRFLLANPEQLWAASICSPGNITQINSQKKWWLGTSDFTDAVGSQLDLSSLRSVPVHTIVGSEDDGRPYIDLDRGSPYWRPGSGEAGATRVERTAQLAANLRQNGVSVRSDVVAGSAHTFADKVPLICAFLEGAMGKSAQPR